MSLIKNVAWMLAGRWVYNLTTLVSFTFIVSLISPAAFGIYTLASTFLIFSDTFFSDGVENLVVRQEGEEERIAPTLFWVSVGFSAASALVIAAVAVPFGILYDSIPLTEATLAISLIVLVQGMAAVPRALLMRHGQQRRYATNSAIGNLIGAAVGIATAWAGAGFWSLLFQQACLHLTMLLLCSVASGFRPRYILDREVARTFARHTATMLWSTFLNVLGNRLDILVLGTMFGEAVTGVYGLAKRLIQIIQDMVASSFDKVLLSMISRQKMKGQADRIYRASVLMQGITAIPSFAGFAIVSSALVPLVFGHEWTDAAPLIVLMAVGGVFRSMVTIERAQQMAAGQMRAIAHIRLVELLIGLALVVPFGWAGPAYMAVIFSVRYVLGYLLVIWSRVGLSGSLHLIRQTARWLAAPLVTSAVMTGAVWLVLREMRPLGRTELAALVAIFIGASAYAGSLWLLRRWWLPYLTRA